MTWVDILESHRKGQEILERFLRKELSKADDALVKALVRCRELRRENEALRRLNEKLRKEEGL
tara:strand:+ start:745 stop:933 length:189 start_codon:yes stop_codon:yes gene_type:complete